MQYAIQRKNNGVLIGIVDSIEEAQPLLEWGKDTLEIVPTSLFHISVRYVELSGPNGYGCDCPEFETYGAMNKCIHNLKTWMNNSISIFGPDLNEIRDYLAKCYVNINGEDKTSWWINMVNNFIESARKNKVVFI